MSFGDTKDRRQINWGGRTSSEAAGRHQNREQDRNGVVVVGACREGEHCHLATRPARKAGRLSRRRPGPAAASPGSLLHRSSPRQRQLNHCTSWLPSCYVLEALPELQQRRKWALNAERTPPLHPSTSNTAIATANGPSNPAIDARELYPSCPESRGEIPPLCSSSSPPQPWLRSKPPPQAQSSTGSSSNVGKTHPIRPIGFFRSAI
jgi:hypothetical protein